MAIADVVDVVCSTFGLGAVVVLVVAGAVLVVDSWAVVVDVTPGSVVGVVGGGATQEVVEVVGPDPLPLAVMVVGTAAAAGTVWSQTSASKEAPRTGPLGTMRIELISS